MLRFSRFTILLTTLTLSAISHAELMTYVTKKNDTLSGIAFIYCRKVYGEYGFINQLKNLNPVFLSLDEKRLPIGLLVSIPDLNSCLIRQPSNVEESTPIPAAVIDEKTPVSNPIVTPDVPVELKTRIFVTPFFLFKSLEASERSTSANALIASPLMPGLKGEMRTPWSETFASTILVGYHQESYRPSVDRRVNNGSAGRSQIAFKTDYFFESWAWGNDFSAEEKSFLGASTSKQININVGTSSIYQTRVKKKIFDKNQKSAALELRGRYLFAVDDERIKARPGFGYGFSVSLSDDQIKEGFESAVFYDSNTQKNPFYEQSERILGLEFRIPVK